MSSSGNDRGTLYAGVSWMIAIMISPSTMAALVEMQFIPCAVQIINPYLTRSLSMGGAAKGLSGWGETKLSADHVSVVDVPAFVTNCSPLTDSKNFHSPS